MANNYTGVLNTQQTFLMVDDSGTMKKLVDVISTPAMGGAPNEIDTTTQSNTEFETSTLGLKSNGAKTWTANFTPENWNAVKEYEDGEIHTFAVWAGSDGTDPENPKPTGEWGQWTFDGQLSCYTNDWGTDSRRDFSITIIPTGQIIDTVPGTTNP